MEGNSIETVNDQCVGIHGEMISVALPKRIMTRDQALRHAAWLVTLAGDDQRFTEILQAVRNT